MRARSLSATAETIDLRRRFSPAPRRDVEPLPFRRPSGRRWRSMCPTAFLVSDLTVVGCAATLASRLSPAPVPLTHALALLAFAPAVLGALGLYRLNVVTRASAQLERLAYAVVSLSLVLAGLGLLAPLALHAPWLARAAALALPAIVLTRAALGLGARALLSRRPIRTLVIGSARSSAVIVDWVRARAGDEILAGVLGSELYDVSSFDETVAATRRLVERDHVDRVIIAGDDLERGELVQLAHDLQDGHVEVWATSEAFGVFAGRVPGQEIGGRQAYRVRRSHLWTFWGPLVKRAFDIGGSLAGIVALGPLLVAIAIAVKLTSPGPVLFKQRRVGRAGRSFTFLKFRSMIAGAPNTAHREYVRAWMTGEAAGTDETGREVFKLVGDPRITRVGRFIRRTSLDELPQLFNVLRGEMSLVGPRPSMPYERELFEPWQVRRLDVTPGCTGLWQVSARGKVGFEDMVLLDLHYIAVWTPLEDLRLVAKTVPVMVFGEGGG